MVNGIIYVNSTNFVTYSDGNVYALNAMTGAVLWTAPTSGGLLAQSSPAVADGIVYVTYAITVCCRDTYLAELAALDAITGVTLWTAPTSGAAAPPAVKDGMVYVGNDYGSVQGFSSATGALVWTTHLASVRSTPRPWPMGPST